MDRLVFKGFVDGRRHGTFVTEGHFGGIVRDVAFEEDLKRQEVKV